MLNMLILPLASVLITIGFGYYAGMKKAFTPQDNQTLVKVIMNYALPLSIFAGIWATPRTILMANIPLGFWLFVGMIGFFIVFIFFYLRVLHNQRRVAILKALSVTAPSIPFIGSALLPFILNSHTAAITIGLAALYINLIMLPVTLIFLSPEHHSFRQMIFRTIKQPLVVAVVVSFILSIMGVPLPKDCTNIFMNLGKAAGGLSMFSIGILLSTNHVVTNRSVSVNVFIANIIIPAVIWILMIFSHVNASIQAAVIIALAIPTGSLPSMLSIRFHVDESDIASIKFWSTLLSFVTIFIFVLLVK